jgi:N-acetylmuramoyl-L-alanine amidase
MGYQVLVIPGSLHRVQVGAFSQRQNAERLKEELEGKGYPAVIMGSD